MGVRLGVVRSGQRRGAILATRSSTVLDRGLSCPAELTVAIAEDETLWLGAFQRAAGLPSGAWSVQRRGSGGPEIRVAAGCVHLLLSLASPSALVPCDEKRIVNRYVRPLLRALSKTGHLAHYFGRDWVSVRGEPVAWVGFAHDSTTKRTAFEAVVAVGAPFAVHDRESLRGRVPAVVAVEPSRLVEGIVEAYAHGAEALEVSDADTAPQSVVTAEPAWAATREEAIGTIGAGVDASGTFRIGGDLFVSRDALARLEAAAPSAGERLGALVDDTLAAPGVALEGVRSLTSIRDVVAEALESASAGTTNDQG